MRLIFRLQALALVAAASPLTAQEPTYPVTARVLVDSAFRGSEGITFNGEGRMFVTGTRGLWEVWPDGTVKRLADLQSNLGLAGIGERDILIADFGPTAAIRTGPGNDDGLVLRATPEGRLDTVATGIGDPNAILVMPDRSLLVSDDFTDKIYEVRDGRVRVFLEGIPFPNGLALSPDHRTLYVAQIFTQIVDTVLFANQVWAVPLEGGRVAGRPEVIARTPAGGANDGLALDAQGRIYVAVNQAGAIWRIDPPTGETVLITEGVPHVASLVFGEGEWDRRALYAISTFNGGSRLWVVPVGVEGAPLIR